MRFREFGYGFAAGALAIVPGRNYTAHITAEASGLTGNWQLDLRAQVRGP